MCVCGGGGGKSPSSQHVVYYLIHYLNHPPFIRPQAFKYVSAYHDASGLPRPHQPHNLQRTFHATLTCAGSVATPHRMQP